MRVLLHTPDPADGISLHRAWGPYGAMARAGQIELIKCPTNADWTLFAQADALVLQRPFSPQEVSLARQAKLHGLRVIVDWDDDLTAVPSWNSSYQLYASDAVQACLPELAKLADVVQVSTKQLKRVYGKWNKRCVVIPNGLDDRLLEQLTPPERQNYICAWRGSKSHLRDFDGVLDELKDCVQDSEGWDFLFYGSPPYTVREAFPLASYLPPEPNAQYLRKLHTLAPKLLIVPLLDTSFNRAKSNLAWLEASLVGAAVLAPDWEEWRQPGVTLYSDAKDFKKKLSRLLRGEAPCQENAQKSWEQVKKHFLWSTINKRRLEALSPT